MCVHVCLFGSFCQLSPGKKPSPCEKVLFISLHLALAHAGECLAQVCGCLSCHRTWLPLIHAYTHLTCDVYCVPTRIKMLTSLASGRFKSSFSSLARCLGCVVCYFDLNCSGCYRSRWRVLGRVCVRVCMLCMHGCVCLFATVSCCGVFNYCWCWCCFCFGVFGWSWSW